MTTPKTVRTNDFCPTGKLFDFPVKSNVSSSSFVLVYASSVTGLGAVSNIENKECRNGPSPIAIPTSGVNLMRGMVGLRYLLWCVLSIKHLMAASFLQHLSQHCHTFQLRLLACGRGVFLKSTFPENILYYSLRKMNLLVSD